MAHLISKNDGWQLSKNCVQQRLMVVLSRSQWTDCTFRVGEENLEIIHGHKLILAATSPVFEALFYGPLANENNQMIDIPDIEPQIFHQLLSFVYSDEIELNSIEEAGELLYAAKKYLVQPLHKKCITFLKDQAMISTLWDILYIAEDLNEEELLTECIKIMSRYHYDIWNNERDNFSSETLCQLLKVDTGNMSEGDLWMMAMDWARKELIRHDLTDSLQDRRSLLENAGALSKMRFLTMTPMELSCLDGILTELEMLAIKESRPLEGFCDISIPRKQIRSLFWVSDRDLIVTRNQMWLNRGEVSSVILSSTKVLILGFEMYTRLAPVEIYVRTPATNSSYKEHFEVSITDESGLLKQKIDYNKDAMFNSTQYVNLIRPFWFEPNMKYTVSVNFISGLYPICSHTDSVGKGAKFAFQETILAEDTRRISSSFILSIKYAL